MCFSFKVLPKTSIPRLI
jgi:hypothetical protein